MTKATPRERAAPRFYAVDKSTRFERPVGYDFCGPVVRHIVGRDEGDFTLSLELWEPAIADNTVAVVLATGTLLNVAPISGFAFNDGGQLTVQRAHLIHMGPHDAGRLTANQDRTGEVLVWPLTRWGPPKPLGYGLEAQSLAYEVER